MLIVLQQMNFIILTHHEMLIKLNLLKNATHRRQMLLTGREMQMMYDR